MTQASPLIPSPQRPRRSPGRAAQGAKGSQTLLGDDRHGHEREQGPGHAQKPTQAEKGQAADHHAGGRKELPQKVNHRPARHGPQAAERDAEAASEADLLGGHRPRRCHGQTRREEGAKKAQAVEARGRQQPPDQPVPVLNQIGGGKPHAGRPAQHARASGQRERGQAAVVAEEPPAQTSQGEPAPRPARRGRPPRAHRPAAATRPPPIAPPRRSSRTRTHPRPPWPARPEGAALRASRLYAHHTVPPERSSARAPTCRGGTQPPRRPGRDRGRSTDVGDSSSARLR